MSNLKTTCESIILNRPFSAMNATELNQVLDGENCDLISQLIQLHSTHYGALILDAPLADCLLSRSIQCQNITFWKWLVHTFTNASSIGVSAFAGIENIEGIHLKHILQLVEQAYSNKFSFIRPVTYQLCDGKEDIRLQLKTNAGFFMPFVHEEFMQIKTALKTHPELLWDTPYAGMLAKLIPSRQLEFKEIIFRQDTTAIKISDIPLSISFSNYEICLAILRFNEAKRPQLQSRVFIID